MEREENPVLLTQRLLRSAASATHEAEAGVLERPVPPSAPG